MTNPNIETAQVFEVLKSFDTVMLTTYESAGRAPLGRARPMGVAKLDEDCTLWFITSATSAKVNESMNAQHQAIVTGQSGSRQITLVGRTDVSRDQARIQELWSKAYEVWFPKGPTDPDVCVLRFRTFEAELWDSSGFNGIKFVFESAKALFTGAPIKNADKKQHQRVRLVD
jgi:general stress protein 26